jgi:hypothetical protein
VKGFRDGSMASCIRGLGSPGLCSEMSLPSLWKDNMKNCSCGVSREGVLSGLRRCMVVLLAGRCCKLMSRYYFFHIGCGVVFCCQF